MAAIPGLIVAIVSSCTSADRIATTNTSIIDQYNDQHRRMLSAIKSREPERAAMLMKEHLETARLSLTRAAAT